MEVGIIGAGKWGQAIRHHFMQSCRVKIYSRTPRDLEGFCSLDEVMKCEYLVFAISAQHTNAFLKTHFKFQDQKILIASKGIDLEKHKFLMDIFSAYVPKENLCYLSGPSFANEVMHDLPTALLISSKNKKVAKKFASFFGHNIKAYVAKDIVGAEVAGAYKNVIAIAAGVCDGLKLGNNARAALVSRGLVEMARFGKAFGAKNKTFLNISGSGDLFLSASSVQSRNYRVGLGLAKGEPIEVILHSLGEVAEGVPTTQAIIELAQQKDIYVPIAKEVHNMLNGQDAKVSVSNLLQQRF